MAFFFWFIISLLSTGLYQSWIQLEAGLLAGCELVCSMVYSNARAFTLITCCSLLTQIEKNCSWKLVIQVEAVILYRPLLYS